MVIKVALVIDVSREVLKVLEVGPIGNVGSTVSGSHGVGKDALIEIDLNELSRPRLCCRNAHWGASPRADQPEKK